MSGARFALAMAWRETRGSRRTLGLLVSAIAVGVAALVGIRSFAESVTASVREQARALLGADLVAGSARAFSEAAEERLRGLQREAAAHGAVAAARVVSFGAMALVEGRERARLVQVFGVEPGYPFYGDVATEPEGLWRALAGEHVALVDEALLVTLDAKVGDTLVVGSARFPIRASVRSFPGDVSVRASLGPRVFLPLAGVDETGLLGFGSRARYETFLRLPEAARPERLAERHRPPLAAERVSLRSVAEDQRRLNESLSRLTRYVGLVSLIALLLGGIGVSSAVHVLIRRRQATIAVLRCLGASGRRVLGVYLAQALGLGILGSSLGACAGVVVAYALPRLAGDLLPVAVAPGASLGAVASGLATGVLAAGLFALPPLLAVRRVPPLAALRRDLEPQAGATRGERALAALALGTGIVAMASVEARSLGVGAAFAAGLFVALLVLWLAAVSLRASLRRVLSPRLAYPLRQGLANLHRPANQTLAVVLALGFGAFLLATLIGVQHNLMRELRTGEGPRTNLAVFDVQPDQQGAVVAELSAAGADPQQPVPIVPMRLSSIKGVPVSQRLAQAAANAPQAGPAGLLRREYRSTYRRDKAGSEELVAGAWWSGAAASGEAAAVSIEADVARQLGVAVGDEIVWDVQGVPVRSRVASLRRVEWARFEPNFFAVFQPGALEGAPQTSVALGRVEDAGARARLTRRLADRFPNVSVLDLADVQRTLETLLGKVAWAVRFLALFSVAAGALVLLGAVMASRLERLREAVLLKTLGATRRQVLRVILAEYASLGLLAALTGVLLATLASWALVRFLFESSFVLPVLPLLALAASVVALTVALGGAGSRDVFRKTSLELLRNE